MLIFRWSSLSQEFPSIFAFSFNFFTTNVPNNINLYGYSLTFSFAFIGVFPFEAFQIVISLEFFYSQLYKQSALECKYVCILSLIL